MKINFFFIFMSLLPVSIFANTCPWQTANELILKKKTTEAKDLILSTSKLKQDLDCLEHILTNVYLPGINSSKTPISDRLNRLKNKITSRKSSKFLDDLFSLHDGLIDRHLSYRFGKSEKSFEHEGAEYGLPMVFKKTGNLFERVDEKGNARIKSCNPLTPVALKGVENRYVFRLRKGLSINTLITCILEDGRLYQLPQAYSVPSVFVLNEQLSVDKIHTLSKDIIYLRPGNLREFTSYQKQAINFIRTHDKKLILDLVSNPGGENYFANGLSKAIFTPSQKIPGFTIHQLFSKFQMIGYANTLLLADYQEWNSWREVYVDPYGSLSTRELVAPFTVEKTVHEFQGERLAEYKSDIIILTSDRCTSACETFVEQLSWHPRVRVIGKNTGGMIHYGNAATFILPHSKIKVSVPTYVSSYESDAPEGVGYPVFREMEWIDLSKPEDLFIH